MKKKYLHFLFGIVLAILLLAGCGGISSAEIPYPDDYYTETEEGGGTADEHEDISAEVPAARTKIRYFLDTSGSIRRSPEAVKVHSAASKCGAGYEDRCYYSRDGQELTEVTEQLALSGEYGDGAPIDLIGSVDIPYEATGVNVITTDLQSNTSCTDLGRWLVSTKSTGYSFYVFTMSYEGNLEFMTYTSNSVMEEVSVKGCSFDDKEFLMIVFGDNALVEEFDKNFQDEADAGLNYDTCHVSLSRGTEEEDMDLALKSSRSFADNVANVTYDNTHFVYGLAQVDTEDTVFTCENTFVYRKSARSANEARNAAKVILYAVPEEGVQIPAVENTEVKVQEYDEEEGLYKDGEVSFTVSAAPYLDGLPAAVDDSESDRDDVLNQALGGDIVAEGPVFTVTAENTDLPKGLYAVEVKLVFEASGEAADLQQFAAAHSAGLEDYSAALETECEPWAEAGGQVSSSRFGYRGDGETSVFRKLLEFDRLTNELIVAGAAGEPVHKTMTFRLVIDNR